MAKLIKKKSTKTVKAAKAAKSAKSAKATKIKTAKSKAPAGKRRGTHELAPLTPPPPLALGLSATVLDRLYAVVQSRRDADPAVSHSARLLSRGIAKIAQKFGEEAVECLIEAVGGSREALIAESADVLYHLLVLWVASGVHPEQVWAELQRREGISGIAEKASRGAGASLPLAFGLQTTKIP